MSRSAELWYTFTQMEEWMMNELELLKRKYARLALACCVNVQ